MDITAAFRLIVGLLLGFYLIFNGWMALKKNRIFIPFNIKFGLWVANKIYGKDVAKQEEDKFVKDQLSQGKQMIVVGVIAILISVFSAFSF